MHEIVSARSVGSAWYALVELAHGMIATGQGVECEPSSSQGVERTVEFFGLALVSDPLAEPRVHLADMLGQAEIRVKKAEYVDVVLRGELDRHIGSRLHYTYHDRLFNWEGLDQVGAIVEKLESSPTSRRAQATTWHPVRDVDSTDPPCLQRVQFLVRGDRLHMYSFWRSRDLFGAWGSNAHAMVELQRMVAGRLNLPLGVYGDLSVSLHVYEKSFPYVQEIVQIYRAKVVAGVRGRHLDGA